MKHNTSCIFDKTGTPQLVDAWPSYGRTEFKCFFQGHNNPLPSLRTEPRFDILTVVVNLGSNQLSCSAAVVEILALNVLPKITTVQYTNVFCSVLLHIEQRRRCFYRCKRALWTE